MSFLDLSNTSSTDNAPRLTAGTHRVNLTKLAYVASKDKALAVFTSTEGAEYLEWLGTSSDGAKKRMKAFLILLTQLAGVSHDLNFASMDDFDALGLQIVDKCPALQINLVDDTYEGKTRQILSGYFSDAITEAPVDFDPTADGF
jgi:hypothetical protein